MKENKFYNKNEILHRMIVISDNDEKIKKRLEEKLSRYGKSYIDIVNTLKHRKTLNIPDIILITQSLDINLDTLLFDCSKKYKDYAIELVKELSNSQEKQERMLKVISENSSEFELLGIIDILHKSIQKLKI